MDFSSSAHEAARRRLQARFDKELDPWWDGLPAVVAELGDRWSLTVGSPVGRGNTSLVLRCRREDGSAAILKLIPDRPLAVAEAAALRSWEPSGRVPAVWRYDPELGALLLEAIPGETPVSESARQVSLREVAGLIGALHQAGTPAVGQGVVSLAERVEFIFGHWTERYRGHTEVTDVVSLARLQRGGELARRLVADGGPSVLLHGDLHPGNVLDAGQSSGLVAIDPRPCVGEPAFDVVDWVFWNTEARDWESRSRDLASALHIEYARIWAWCSAFAAMLAAGRVSRGASAVEALLALAP
jgi:streptomycin 6-kinase